MLARILMTIKIIGIDHHCHKLQKMAKTWQSKIAVMEGSGQRCDDQNSQNQFKLWHTRKDLGNRETTKERHLEIKTEEQELES